MMSVIDYQLPAGPFDALAIGKAGEHLVCCDLLTAGFHAFLADQGSPFDLIAVAGDKLWKVQVKTTLTTKNVNSQGRNPRMAYSWSVRRRGKGGSSRLTSEHCDLIALVALDIREIAWFPVDLVGETIQLSPPGQREIKVTRDTGWSRSVDGYSFSAAISGSDLPYQRDVTHCAKGHEYTFENKYLHKRLAKDGSPFFSCLECDRERSRRYMKAKRSV